MNFVLSSRNAVIIALMQVGVIVAGVLASGITDKFFFSGDFGGVGEAARPAALWLVLNVGFLLLSIPLAWITVLAFLSIRPQVPEVWRSATFLCGPLIIFTLLVFFAWVTTDTIVCVLGEGV